MLNARRIGLLGQRRVFAVTSYLAYACAKLGIEAQLLDNRGGMLAEEARYLDREDALLAVSFTPYTPETIEIATAVAERGVPVLDLSRRAQNAYERAIGHLKKSLETDPRRRSVYDEMMEIYALKGEYGCQISYDRLSRRYKLTRIIHARRNEIESDLGGASARTARSTAAARLYAARPGRSALRQEPVAQ